MEDAEVLHRKLRNLEREKLARLRNEMKELERILKKSEEEKR
jgi:hypothetical protein